jgi:putative cell wall-binding protein
MVPGPAAATHGASTLTAESQPTIVVGQANQPAGNLVLTPTTAGNTFAGGEQITITLDDSDGGANCSSATDYVAFNSAPTVAVSSGTATVTSAVSASAGACAAAGRNDVLTITFQNPPGSAVLTISNIRYDVGASAARGPVTVTTGGTAPVATGGAGASNAFITEVRIAANTPAVGIRVPTGPATAQAISNIVVTEQAFDALSAPNNASGRFCIDLNDATDFFDANAPAPTVAVSPTGDTATVALASGGNALEVTVTDAAGDTTASTFTISGLRLAAASITAANAGIVTATLYQGPCNAATPTGAVLSGTTTLAAIVDVVRFAGSDRFQTAQLLFEDAFPCAPANGLSHAIIARADDFPDALAASFLAGKRGTGILLVDRNSTSLPAATINALRNRGVDTVTIIGGPTAVPAVLANALDLLPNVTCAGATQAAPNDTIAVERIEGADRYETARLVAAAGAAIAGGVGTADYDGTSAAPFGGTCNARRTAILATGQNFPDALVAGPVAFNGVNVPAASPTPPGPGCGNGEGFPVILTTSGTLNSQAASALTTLGIEQVLIMGGNTAIDPAVVTSVQGINSITTRRFAGTNRLDTARQFAEFAIDFLGYSRTLASVARGDDFPDALAGGPHAGTAPAAAILLTESPTSAGAETLAFFRDRHGSANVFGAGATLVPITELDVYGGTVAVANSVIDAIVAAISQA